MSGATADPEQTRIVSGLQPELGLALEEQVMDLVTAIFPSLLGDSRIPFMAGS